MPEKELSLEEFRKLQESLGQEPVPQSSEEVNRAIGKRTAEATTPIPSPSAAFGRENILGDLFGLGNATAQSFINPMEALRGFPALRESFTSAVTPQRKPSLEFLKGSDIGRMLPDLAQAGTAAIGQELGALGGPIGAVAGSTVGSLAGNVLANKMQDVSPELFGNDLGTVKIGGTEIPTEEFNLMMDAGIPMVSGVSKFLMSGLKQKTTNALVKHTGRFAPEEIQAAMRDITNPANNVDTSYIPKVTAGTYGGPLEAIEQVASSRGRINIHQENAIKTRNFLKNEVGLTEEELKDMEPKRASLEAANALPQRRNAQSFEFPPGTKLSPATTRGIDMLAGAGHTWNHLRAKAKERYNFVADNLVSNFGNKDITLDAGTKESLLDLHTGLSQLIEETPELANAYGKPKRTIEQLLNLPQTTKRVAQKGDKIVTLEKTVETPKKTKITTGETKYKATSEGKTKEFFSETIDAEKGDVLNTTSGTQKTTNIPGATENPELPVGVDFNALVELNSQLKRGVSRGKLVKSEDLPVISTINYIENAIRNDLKSRPGIGNILYQKYNEGSKATALRYRLFKPGVENLLKGEPEKAWDTIFNSEAAMNSYIKATKGKLTAQKESIAHILENSTEIKDGLEVFSPNQALKTWKNSPGLRTLYTANTRNKIEQFLKVAASSTPDISDIGKFAVAMRSGNLVMNVGTGFLSSSPTSSIPRAVAGATIWFGGRVGLSKLLLDPEAAAIATRLLKTPTKSPRALGDMRRLMQYLNGVKVTVNMGNQSFETTIDSDILNKLKFANRQAPNPTYDLLQNVQQVAPAQQ